METQDRQDGVNSIGIIEKEIIEKGRKIIYSEDWISHGEKL